MTASRHLIGPQHPRSSIISSPIGRGHHTGSSSRLRTSFTTHYYPFIIIGQVIYGMIILKAIIIRSLPDVLLVLQFLAPVCDGEPQPHLHTLHQTWPIRGQNYPELPNQKTVFYQVIEPWHHLRLPYGTESQKIIKSIQFLRATQSGIHLTSPGVISGMVNFPCFMMTGPR